MSHILVSRLAAPRDVRLRLNEGTLTLSSTCSLTHPVPVPLTEEYSLNWNVPAVDQEEKSAHL